MSALFGRLETVIKGAVSVVALVPGIALVSRSVVLPPDLQDLLGGLALALGTVIILGVVLNRGRIRRTPAQRIGLVSAGLASAGFIAAIFGFNFAQRHLVPFKPNTGEQSYLLVPLRPSAELRSLLDQAGGSWPDAILNPGIGHLVRELMRAESGTAVWMLALLLLLAQALLLTAIVLAAWKASEQLKGPVPAQPA
jgi:hypothetical protein